MKILLVGEYSRLHNSLKEGLEMLGHKATIVAPYDGFKKYDVDILIKKKYQKGISRRLKNIIFKISGIDLVSISIKRQILNLKTQLSDYDLVQFINEASFGCLADTEKEIFDLITTWNNKKSFLLSCGTDYISVNYANDGLLKHSYLTPFKNGKDKKSLSSYGLKYLKPEFKILHEHIFSAIIGVIASDIDYQIPLKAHPKFLGMIPNPVNTDLLKYSPPVIKDKIIIFHGINSSNYFKKGNDIFEDALEIIQKKYSDKIEVISVRSLPYEEYINAYNNCHILLDQIYAYDQGYNALEAMAKGKVVFTGAENEWLEYYNLDEDSIAINALPDTKYIVKKLEWLITNPDKIKAISEGAKQFIEDHHNYIKSAQTYLDKWIKNL